MFDITTGKWRPAADVLVEVVNVPSGTNVPRQLVLDGPGLALVQHARGGTSLGGVAGPSLTPLGPGDRIILLPGGEFVLALAVTTATDEQTAWFKIAVTVTDPERFVSSLVCDDQELTAIDIAQQISRDGAVRLAVQRARSVQSDLLPEDLFAELAEPLDLLFGLRLREVLSDIVMIDGGGVAAMLRPGDVLTDDWRLVERIGQGAAGDVWLVEHTRHPDQLRALKVLRNPAVASLVNREARQIMLLEQSGVDFQHIARLEAVVPLDVPGLLYEYVPGVSLREHVAGRGGRLSEAEAMLILQQVLSGLAELHRAGIIHRDLHPGNIIVSGQPEGSHTKILDLGLAYLIDPAGSPESFRQSSLNLQPTHRFVEQMPVDQAPDPRTDLYSAGVLLWWMLTGDEGLPVGRRLRDAWPQGNKKTVDVVQEATLTPRTERYATASVMSAALAATTRRRWLPEIRSGRQSRGAGNAAVRSARSTFRQRHPYLTRLPLAILALSALMFAPLLLLGGLLFLALKYSATARVMLAIAAIVFVTPVVVLSVLVLTTALLVFG